MCDDVRCGCGLILVRAESLRVGKCIGCRRGVRRSRRQVATGFCPQCGKRQDRAGWLCSVCNKVKNQQARDRYAARVKGVR